MEKSKGIKTKKGNPQKPTLFLNEEETKRIADVFSVLIQIDRRVNMTKSYGKSPNK